MKVCDGWEEGPGLQPRSCATAPSSLPAFNAGKKAAKRHKSFPPACEDLQDDRGDLNEIATGHEILDGLTGTEAGTGSALFAAGVTMGDIEARTRKLLASAAKAHQALVDVRPF